jgi:hypothetical protein
LGDPRGQIALISSEAGIGRSRPVKATKARTPAGTLIMEEHCFQTESALPYAPLLDLFRNFFASRMNSFANWGINTDWSPPWLVPVTLRIAMIQFSCRLSRGRKIITWLWEPWSQKQYRRTSIFAADFRPVTRAALQKRGLVY